MKTGKLAASVLGVLFILGGLVVSLQGAGYIGGSMMTGSSFWLYVGAGVLVLGVLLLLGGFLMGSRMKQGPIASAS